MTHSLLKTTGPILATLATLLFTSALAGAATVIDHVPYVITESGEYELQRNLTVTGKDGITVQAANVTINLNGFTLAEGEPDLPGNGVVVAASNVTVRNGTISGFVVGVSLQDSLGTAQDLKLLVNTRGVYLPTGDDNSVVNCFVVGAGETFAAYGIIVGDASGTLVKNNHICECRIGLLSESSRGNAFIYNYVANSGEGLNLADHDFYQGNVATGCDTAFKGGHAIGTENGGD
jgi:nitrous oxidase accessory protein NosD